MRSEELNSGQICTKMQQTELPIFLRQIAYPYFESYVVYRSFRKCQFQFAFKLQNFGPSLAGLTIHIIIEFLNLNKLGVAQAKLIFQIENMACAGIAVQLLG